MLLVFPPFVKPNKAEVLMWIFQICICISYPLPNQIKFYRDFTIYNLRRSDCVMKNRLRVLRRICLICLFVDLVTAVNAWVCSAFSNVFSSSMKLSAILLRFLKERTSQQREVNIYWMGKSVAQKAGFSPRYWPLSRAVYY